ncbi:VOC family protein [Novosphingobium sp. KACC 22771]|uniref:VOC family protein n=1 Tax=Novosphingobium sp. KACC 22771 TaxID=3025670 RepID=UPI00236693B5|nr:VOC family protein [Novosphingobium sp. KACC 22771]WDF72794.1 VOC family protein [Novosphingobium sp. KACC 22771]
MFSHIFVGSTDLARSKTFYDALFAAVGGPEGVVDTAKNRLVYVHKGAAFIVAIPINGESACVANGGTIGFGLDNEAQVDAWHAAGIAHGGATCEDPPGLRKEANLYLAYLRDPDGHKLCALYRPA